MEYKFIHSGDLYSASSRLWRSCHNEVTTRRARPWYGNSICIEIFSDVFLPICFQWKESLLNWIEADTCTNTVTPASIEMINYYFHQISSFCYFNVLMYYVVLIAGGTYRSLVTPLWQDRQDYYSEAHQPSHGQRRTWARCKIWKGRSSARSAAGQVVQSIEKGMRDLKISLRFHDYRVSQVNRVAL